MTKNFALPTAAVALGLAAGFLASPALAQAARPAAPRPAAAATSPAGRAVTRAEINADVETSFAAIDTNKDGALSKAEIAAAEARNQQQMLTNLTARRKAVFDKFDANHDGSISYAEFTAASPLPAIKSDDGSQALAQLDTNHDGKVSKEEFRAPRMSRFDALDTNHDGTISVEEQRAAGVKHR